MSFSTNAVAWGLENRNLDNIKTIGVDEIAHSKGYKYFTLVYQIDAGMRRLIWIGSNRTESTFDSFFEWFGAERCRKIVAVCSDMWKPYLKIILKRIPNGLHILDRFHVAQHLNKAVDEVRAAEHKKLQEDGYDPILTKSKWTLLKKRENLTDKQEVSLKELLKYNLKSMKHTFFLKKNSVFLELFIACLGREVFRSMVYQSYAIQA